MIETPESIWINVVEIDADEYKAVHGYAHKCPKGTEYLLKSTVDKERDDILELWEADIADHNKTIAALATCLEYYAERDNWIDTGFGANYKRAPISYDDGKQSKQALTDNAAQIKQAQDDIK